MIIDSTYHVSPHDWPAGARETDLTPEQANDVLNEFDTYYPIAVRGLATVVVPKPADGE
ncbi:hypothetical protein O7626_01085 [Micromonospora sp. WMMD1102]|uniref:hypothetical protein n=1 Tax=Micromonospora sp. WMMD1102 TaxID=3016105 RepID=UPI00241517E9|nr:hypothetical protein [Micromonospora sp. WMMD1102]MDG4784540.1 hypothetical protein [Micromonospora sp. WMMD1102]